MGKSKRKTKPFIDKKHSTTYTILPKTQAELAQLGENDNDDNYDHREDEVTHLHAASSSSFQEWKGRLTEAGIALSDDDLAHRYLKEMKGDGVFVDARSGQQQSKQQNLLAAANARRTNQQPSSTTVSERTEEPDDPNAALLFDNVDLTLDCMDDDMRKILMLEEIDEDMFENLSSGMVEELDDDFCLQAASEPEPDAQSGFDYDEHIRQLLERARRERDDDDNNNNDSNGHHPGHADRDYFANSRARGGGKDSLNDDDDGDSMGEYDECDVDVWMNQPSRESKKTGGRGVSSKLRPDEEQALCDKFLETLAEYDDSDDDDNDEDDGEPYQGDNGNDDDGEPPSDDDDDGDGDDEEDGGDMGEADLEAAMDDFLRENEDDILVQGRCRDNESAPKNDTGGSGYSVLVGTRMVPASMWDQVDKGDDDNGNESPESVAEILAEADETLAAPIEILTLESVITVDEFDGKSYFSERTKNPWDCESILSTYSNLDNNPAVIDHTRMKRRKNRVAPPQPATPKILLSTKTGLPIRPSPIAEDEPNDSASQGASTVGVNRGVARNKNETQEEKRARKMAAKQERQMSQARKKELRNAFGLELQKRAGTATTADAPIGSAVFRYS